MQRLEVSGAVRPIYESLGIKGLMFQRIQRHLNCEQDAVTTN